MASVGEQSASQPLEAALAALRAGRPAEAESLCRRVLKARPQHVDAQRVLAEALQMQGRTEGAILALRAALRARPDHGPVRQMLARRLMEDGRPEEAGELWREAARLAPQHAEAHMIHAEYLLASGNAADARAAYERVLELAPSHAPARLRIAQLHARLGEHDAARQRFEALLACEDTGVAGEAAAALAELDRRAGDARAGVERLRPWAGRADLPPAAVGAIHTQLGLALDALGETGEAFTSFERAQRALAPDAGATAQACAQVDRVLDDLRAWTTPERVAAWASPPDAPRPSPPVFLVGFPRAGTTLLEQMLGAHPALSPSDERPAIQPVRGGMVERFGVRPEFPAMLDDLKPNHLRQARKDYLQRMARGRRGETGRVLDKQPLNTPDLVVVRRLFPESPVLFVVRDPRDTVLSCFMQHFSRGLPHLFDLHKTAELYARLMALAMTYRDTLGLAWHEVRYESLVTAPEPVLRAALEHLGEAWDDAVLRSHEAAHRRYVSTPTYADVQQPVYTRAIGRWRRYERELAPVMDTLAPWVQAFGYDA